MRGRKPKPSNLRVLQGMRGHRPLNTSEPRPEPQTPPCPPGLSPAAQEEWKYITAELEPLGVLAKIDKAAVAGYAQSYADWIECLDFLRTNGNVIVLRNDKGEVKQIIAAPQARLALLYLEKVRQFAAELGLSPSARTRIHARPPDKQNPIETFLYGKK